jgi:hypothetical protein
VDSFPVVGRNHFNRIPGTAVEKSAIRSLADAFLATDAEIWIDFDAAERRVIFIGHPEHACFNRAILDAGRRTGATRAAVRRDSKDARPFFASCLAVAFRHGPVFFYDVEHIRSQKSEVRSQKSEVRSQKSEVRSQKSEVRRLQSNIALLNSSTICVVNDSALPIELRRFTTFAKQVA